MKRYENGRDRALRYALECAIRDRESFLESFVYRGLQDLPREEFLSRLRESDREHYVRAESYIRDFKTLLNGMAKD